jgi:hypothetical protein
VERDERERLATLEEQIKGLREDVSAMTAESSRTRTRLHELESTQRGLVLQAEAEKAGVSYRQRRLEVRVQVLTAVIAAGALIEPFLYASIHSK